VINLLLSGEGKTDMGEINYSEPSRFNEGPMACLAKMIIKRCTDEPVEMELIHKSVLTQKAKAQRKVKLPGKKNRQTTGYFYKNAYTLGQIALEKGCDVAILFRDADGTHSTVPSNWRTLVQSILDGFEDSGFQNGVAMVPKPTGEAWILCCLQHYQHCEKLEDLPDNQASSSHPKKRLQQKMGKAPTRETLLEIVCEMCDTEQIDMPSFVSFKNGLEKVIGVRE
jgi:hypothetical protein